MSEVEREVLVEDGVCGVVVHTGVLVLVVEGEVDHRVTGHIPVARLQGTGLHDMYVAHVLPILRAHGC